MVGKGKILAKKTFQLQLCVIAICSLFCLIIFNTYAGLSYLLGAGISVLPSMVFAFFAFRFAGATKKELVMKSFSQGSKLKLAIILFVLAYQLTLLQPVFMLIGFAVTTATHTIGIIWMSKRQSTISN
jgi:ATP synthase protein I